MLIIMGLPNFLTLFRVLVSPLFMLLYLYHDSIGISFTALPFVLIFFLIVCELTDGFDGYFARKLDKVSDLGKLIDPMADSIYRISVFLTFTRPPVDLPLILVFIFLYRDSVISTLRSICALKGFALAARLSGKVKAVLQAISAFSVLLLMIPFAYGLVSLQQFQNLSFYIVGVAALYSLASGVEYIWANRAYIQKML